MNKKKVLIIGIIILFLVLAGVWYFFIYNPSEKSAVNEIVPEEEISEEQMRQTIVSLYFYNPETKSLMPEGRLIDVKDLLDNPYQKLIGLLIEGPQNQSLTKTIPDGTKVNKIELKGDILYVDLSKEFIDNHKGGVDEEKASIYSIVNTMTNLTEVNGVKILIEGEENKAFKDNIIKFDDPFVVVEESEEKEEENEDEKSDSNTIENDV